MAKCVVSFTDHEGLRHEVELEAGSLYEAAALAAKSFAEHGCRPARLSELRVEIKPPAVVHVVTLRKVEEFIRQGPKSPKDMAHRLRLKELMQAVEKAS